MRRLGPGFGLGASGIPLKEEILRTKDLNSAPSKR